MYSMFQFGEYWAKGGNVYILFIACRNQLALTLLDGKRQEQRREKRDEEEA